GERIALVLAERTEGAARLAVHRAWVGRRPTLAVEQSARLQLLALVAGDAHLAHGDHARRHIENDRPLALRARDCDTNRADAEAGIRAAPRRHRRPRVGDIDKMERDEALAGADLAI